MRFRGPCQMLALTAVLCALPLSALRADNPRLTLKVTNATATEAAQQLARAAGVAIRFQGEGPAQELRASFDWQAVPLSRALRQLCQKFNLDLSRQTSGYVLQQGGAPAPAKLVGLVEKNGIRLWATGATLQDQRAINFVGEANDWGSSQLNLQLAAELGDRDGESIAGFENVKAMDDAGTLLIPEPGRPSYSGGYGAVFPDEWSGSLTLPPPSPRARKLLWVEGDLVAYRTLRPLQIEVPLPLTEKSVRRQAGDWLIAVSQYDAKAKEPDDDDTGLPDLGRRLGTEGPSVRVRVYSPLHSTVSWRAGAGWTPVLVTASGRRYTPITSGGSGAGNGQLTLSDSRLVYPATDSAPARLVWDLVQKEDPERILSFHMGTIPLPVEPLRPAPGGAKAPPPVTRAASPVPPPTTELTHLSEESPFYQRAGAVLAARVQIEEQPAPAGTLQLGLSEKRGAAWGPVRWTEAAVDASGALRLADLKPGEYRLQRRYRPTAAPAGWNPGDGKWQSGEVVVKLAAGKESVVPVLRWVRGAGR